jgi:protein TonB
VLASLALHALLLFVLPVLQEVRRQMPVKTLTARLVEQKPAPPAARREEPPPKPQSPPPAQAQPRPRPALVPRPAPPQPAPAPSVETPKPPVEPAVAPPPAVPAAPPAPAATAKSEARVTAPAPVSPEADSLAQYRMEIIELARRFKRYPRIAQDNNWTGTASVRMVIGADGAIESLTVRSSAGHAILDQEAINMLRTAKSKAAIPTALRGKTITLDVPVIFNIKDEGG